MNAAGDRVPARLLQKAGQGRSIQILNPVANAEYVIGVQSLATSTTRTGNYIVTVDFSTEAASMESVFSGIVTATQTDYSRLQTNKSQLFDSTCQPRRQPFVKAFNCRSLMNELATLSSHCPSALDFQRPNSSGSLKDLHPSSRLTHSTVAGGWNNLIPTQGRCFERRSGTKSSRSNHPHSTAHQRSMELD